VGYIRSQVPDEFLVQFNGWVEQIESVVADLKQRISSAFDHAPKTTRKDFALWVQAEHKELAPYLFATLDGHAVEPIIYRNAFRDHPDAQVLLPSESTA
jgi:hypothetical protein